MVLFLAMQVFSVLALGPQVVLSTSGYLSFQTEVTECEPVNITVVGNLDAHAIPAWLTLVPFNSKPISIPISNNHSDTSSVRVSFLPLAADTAFIASLDDANGNSVADVSDITQVLPSPTGNKTCHRSTPAWALNDFVVNSTFSQCGNFTLEYSRTVISHAPTVRMFSPKEPSRYLNLMGDNTTTGTATYLLRLEKTKEFVLVFDDGSGHNASSMNMTVGGDSDSPANCLATTSSIPHKSVIIGASVGSILMVLILFYVFFFVIRARRRRLRGANLYLDPASELSKKPLEWLLTFWKGNHVFKKDTSDKEKHASGETMTSWSQPVPSDQQVSTRMSAADEEDTNSLDSLDNTEVFDIVATYSSKAERDSRQTAETSQQISSMMSAADDEDTNSQESLDITGMFVIADAHTKGRESRQKVKTMSLGPPTPSQLPSISSRLSLSSRQSSHDPLDLDLPVSVRRMPSAFSLTSDVDPFADNVPGERHEEVDLPPFLQDSVRTRVRSPRKILVGLPASPRHGFRVMRERSSDVEGVPKDVRLSSTSTSILDDVEDKGQP